uniref:Uncharacterized protein n=1 Tax=virus sp. ctML55 TaxID=2827627 RepID=A0A8S5RIE0_9VIRU|nr:MAG TPA: hypothetical protein [virus sp. ctML55]DAW92001.1 MAG TPA: hypothetical protein [Bacteriophage sp.]
MHIKFRSFLSWNNSKSFNSSLVVIVTKILELFNFFLHKYGLSS